MAQVHSELFTSHAPVVLQQAMRTNSDCKEQLVEQIMDAVQQRDWVDAMGETWLRLCLEEGLLNAMYHGNEGDPELMVEVLVYDDDQRWVIQINDQGDGFNPEAVPPGDDDEALLREHGRGLLLMREWLDSLDYYNGGRTAILSRLKTDFHPADNGSDEG